MRWLIAFIIIALALFFFWPRPDPIPIEETYIGEPVKKLNQAKGYEQEYLKANDAHKAEMEKQLEEAGG